MSTKVRTDKCYDRDDTFTQLTLHKMTVKVKRGFSLLREKDVMADSTNILLWMYAFELLVSPH